LAILLHAILSNQPTGKTRVVRWTTNSSVHCNFPSSLLYFDIKEKNIFSATFFSTVKNRNKNNLGEKKFKDNE
jgi:hypothetical protein